MDYFMKEAIKTAKRSPQKRFKTGCILVNNDRIVGSGWSHCSDLRLSRLYSVHSEIHALLRTPKQFLSGATAYVATIAVKSGNLATTSCPCQVCAGALYAAGIQNVFYTISDGIEEIILNDRAIEACRLYLPEGNLGVAA